MNCKYLNEFIFSDSSVYIPRQILSFTPQLGDIQEYYLDFLETLFFNEISRSRNTENQLKLIGAYNSLLFAINNWEKSNTVTTPISGMIRHSFFQNNEKYATINDTIYMVTTQTKDILVCKIHLPRSYKNNITEKDNLKILIDDETFKSRSISVKINSLNQVENQNILIANIEINNLDDDFFKYILNIKNERIPIILLSDNKSVFARLLSRIKAMFVY